MNCSRWRGPDTARTAAFLKDHSADLELGGAAVDASAGGLNMSQFLVDSWYGLKASTGYSFALQYASSSAGWQDTTPAYLEKEYTQSSSSASHQSSGNGDDQEPEYHTNRFPLFDRVVAYMNQSSTQTPPLVLNAVMNSYYAVVSSSSGGGDASTVTMLPKDKTLKVSNYPLPLSTFAKTDPATNPISTYLSLLCLLGFSCFGGYVLSLSLSLLLLLLLLLLLFLLSVCLLTVCLTQLTLLLLLLLLTTGTWLPTPCSRGASSASTSRWSTA